MLFGSANNSVFISSLSHKCNVKSKIDSVKTRKHCQSLVKFPVRDLQEERQTQNPISHCWFYESCECTQTGFHNHFPVNDEQLHARFLVDYLFLYGNLVSLEHRGFRLLFFVMRQLVRGKNKLALYSCSDNQNSHQS